MKLIADLAGVFIMGLILASVFWDGSNINFKRVFTREEKLCIILGGIGVTIYGALFLVHLIK